MRKSLLNEHFPTMPVNEHMYDLIIDCAAYFIANIDSECNSFEIETFVACLAETAFDGVSLGVAIYNFSRIQKSILTSVDDGVSIVVSSDDVTRSLTKNSDDALDEGLGTYGNQKGHHPLAKSAFSRKYEMSFDRTKRVLNVLFATIQPKPFVTQVSFAKTFNGTFNK